MLNTGKLLFPAKNSYRKQKLLFCQKLIDIKEKMSYTVLEKITG